MSHKSVLTVSGLCLDAPGGRPLFLDLNLSLGRERVAVVGRNGVGKSSLLEVLAGHDSPARGKVVCRKRRLLVRQRLAPADVPGAPRSMSPGEIRRLCLEHARCENPDLLLLDEPTQDLDDASVRWLVRWLGDWDGALIVVSHDRRLLRCFHDFFVLAESGCRHVSGSFEELVEELERESVEGERSYLRNLNRLMEKESHNATVRRRRQRKKNVGRIREVRRAPARAHLNGKRSYAQVSQGKRAVLQKERIDAARAWTKATRRALAVNLPLELAVPLLPEHPGSPIVELRGVTVRAGDRTLFEGIDLELGRERLAIVGANGSGKTTLLQIMIGERVPANGSVSVARARIGYIAQNASNWLSEESLLSCLLTQSDATSPEAAAELLVSHKFPFALATRPLCSLSPGERARAALICLFQRRPAVELLALDEPTDDLDFLGTSALQAVLEAWRGGLAIVSHDHGFLDSIGVTRWVRPSPRTARYGAVPSPPSPA